MAVAKRKTPAKGLNAIRTPIFVQKVRKIIVKNCRKLINAIAKVLKISKHSIGRIVNDDL